MKTKTFIVLMIILLLMAFTAPAYAQSIPPLPHAFYGTVTINGSPAPEKTTVVEARGTGVRTGIQGNPITTTVVGYYGSSDPLGSKLVVQGDIAEGTVISFYVNGVAATQTAAWHAGLVSELNLVATSSGGGGTPPTATPTPTTGGTTSIEVIKYYSDGKTVAETVSLAKMKTMPVQGDGITHYYHQGPSLDKDNLWDPNETVNLKDQGAVKGTDLKDLCNLVGGMSNGDTVDVKATDNFSMTFDYENVYNTLSDPTLNARQGPMVVCWYNQEFGEAPNWTNGPELVFFAQTTNSAGQHVFGNRDMYETMPEIRWHYFNSGGVNYPSSNGYTVKNINRIAIFSQQAATSPTTTPVPTPTPMPVPTLTPVPTPMPTPVPTTTPVPTPTPTSIPEGTGAPTTVPIPVVTPTPAPVHLTISTSTPLDLSDVIGENGVTQNAVEITFSDIAAEIKIGQGATVLTAEGNPLQTMSVQPVAQPPAPLSDYRIIGLAYNFEPSGATFNPPATITLPYDPVLLPKNISQDDLAIAYYDAQSGNWVQLNCTVDTLSHHVTAQVSHFTMFAILGKAAQPGKSEFNWTLVGVVIGAVMIIIGVGGYFLVIHRRKAQAR